MQTPHLPSLPSPSPTRLHDPLSPDGHDWQLQLQEELRRSHHLLRTMNEGFLLMDQDFRLLQINTEGLRIDGRSEAELLGRTHWELWPGSEHAPVGQAYKRAMASRAPARFENCHRFEEGEKWFTIHAYPYGSGLAVIYRDVTDLKLANTRLSEAQERLDATLTAGAVATWIWDIPENRVSGDKNLIMLFGLDPSLIDGAPLSAYVDAVHPDDVDAVRQALDQALAREDYYQVQYRIGKPGGEVRWVLAQARVERDAAGKAVKMPGVVLDITRQRQMEDAWRATEERYRTVINSTDDGFCVVEVLFDDKDRPCDYRFIDANPAFERQTGLHGIVGKRVRTVVPELEQKWFDVYGAVARTGQSVRFTDESTSMGRWFDVFATRLDGTEAGYVAVLFTDISQAKRDEAQLRQLAQDLADANQRKTEFIATLAHELRNPLAPLRTGLDFMRLSGDLPPSYAKVHEMMDRQLKQMVHLIDELMDVARIGSGKIELKLERLNLKQVIANAVEAAFPLVEAAHHQLTARLPDEPLFVDADAARMAQILGNLLTNAAKYTPSGGQISVSVQRAQRDAGAVARIAIVDNGIGIPKGMQHRLFQLFSQVPANASHAQGGLGIGLSLVKSLVELHGGQVSVASDGEGQGSTFVVELPLS